MKIWVWGSSFVIPVFGDWRWVIPGGSRPASLASWVSSRSMRDLVSREMDSVPEDDLRGHPLASTCVHTYNTYNAHKKVLITCPTERGNNISRCPWASCLGCEVFWVFFLGGVLVYPHCTHHPPISCRQPQNDTAVFREVFLHLMIPPITRAVLLGLPIGQRKAK